MTVKEQEARRQLQLVTRLAQTSDLLSIFFPKKELEVWHVVSPQFKRPSISLMGYDISGQLLNLAQNSREFFVSFHARSQEYSRDEYSLQPYHVWEIYPPREFSFIGRFIYDCYQGENLPGLGMSLYCPQIKTGVTLEKLKIFVEEGTLNVDMLSWFREGETFYDRGKPESVLMAMIERHPTVSLEVALWILESLEGAKDIHPEKYSFKL